MNANQKLKISQARHLDLWRSTISGNDNDRINHSYHAKAISDQSKKGRILTKKEKKFIYAGIVRKKAKSV